MTAPLVISGRFVNVEKLLVAYLKGRPELAGRRIGTTKPTPLDASTLPFVQVIRSGGTSGQVTSLLRADVEVMATDRGPMWDLTELVHNAIRALSGNNMGAQLVDVVETIQEPAFVAWSPSVPRSVAVYEFQLRPAPPQA